MHYLSLKNIELAVCGIAIIMGLSAPYSARAANTAFTYQGYLEQSAVAVDELTCFKFQLYDAETGGQAIGPLLQPCDVAVDDGRFTVNLDFGPGSFAGQDRWLEITIVEGGNTTVLSPRQKVTPAPMATYAHTAGQATTATVANHATEAGNGVPAGFAILGKTSTAPDGYEWTGKTVAAPGVPPKWVNGANLPVGLRTPVGGMINGKIYMASNGYTVEYDPATQQWSNKAPMTSYRFDSAGAVLDGKLYVGGGQTGIGVTAAFEAYDPITNSWTARQNMPAPIFRNTAVAANGKLYFFGGDLESTSAINTTSIYDPGTNTWSSGAPMPTGRRSATAVVLDGKIHVIGGDPSSVHEVYDIATNSWTQLGPLPATMELSSALVFGGKIHVLGGYGGMSGLTPQHYIFDPITQTWTSGVELSVARRSACAVKLDDLSFMLAAGDDGSSWNTSAIFQLGYESFDYYVHVKK